MKKNYLCSLAVALTSLTFILVGCGDSSNNANNSDNAGNGNSAPEAITIEKSAYSNPVTGFDNDGNIVYGGDPAALVDGDTVYLYTGHDTATNEAYQIPEYQCYSSKDMLNWTYEGVVLKCSDVTWADNNAAWASQAVKYDDKYYLYFCSWDNTSSGKQSIGVAVSDSPTGPFVDIGAPIVKGSFTTDETSTWNDIDPTIWIETDEDGVEHRYLMWGNGKLYLCELNEDMISVKDTTGDGQVNFKEDIVSITPPSSFTEAPWLYRRQDENGNYYGDYYLFYAFGWREAMNYGRSETLDVDDIFWDTDQIIMRPAATSNTNHPSVIDFKGKTYFIYHNGSLDGGSGFRRVVCIEEITFNDDGSISYIQETAAGVGGTVSVIKNKNGELISHANFVNSSADADYPYKDIAVGANESEDELDSEWVIVAGKADKTNESYVSIISNNKCGLYLTEVDGTIVLAQNADKSLTKAQTFKTVTGLSNGEGVSFESIINPGTYITCDADGNLVMSDGSDKDACTFTVETK